MKKLLFAFLVLVGFAATAPVAEAGQFARVYNGRGVVYVHKSQLYSPSYGSNYYGHRRSHRHYRSYVDYDYNRPYRTSYYAPYPYYRTGYYNSSCGYHSRPRVAISFGF